MSPTRRIAVVTGTRAEFGLLRPVMASIDAHPGLELRVVVTGTHLLPPACTAREVEAAFDVAATIPMQRPGETGRFADAAALGRGTSGIAAWLQEETPDVMLVLGDRIEAFAAASAAAVAGVRVAHMHGGDRAQGIADEALRNAISRLAHVHLPASRRAAERLERSGEETRRIHLVGSPAIDGLDAIPPLTDERFEALGAPDIVVLLHPSGGPPRREREDAARLLAACCECASTTALDPNHDPGREAITDALAESGCRRVAHLERPEFVGLLRRARLLVGNSSAGLIEAAALGVRCVNVGSRQAGRERPANVLDVPAGDAQLLRDTIVRGLREPLGAVTHPYGRGRAGPATAQVLATFDPGEHPLAKRNAF